MNRLLGPALSWIVAVWTLPFPICLAAAQWGGVDTTFTLGSGRNAGFDADTVCVAVQSDGKIVVGGIFAHYQGASRNGIARLNSDGALDATFDPGTGANSTVEALGAQPDGKVIIAGRFTTVNGASHVAVARLNPGGSPDSTFNPSFIGLENIVDTLALQADGRMLIGGAFTLANTAAPAYIARLNVDGTVDTSFVPAPIADNVKLKPSVQSIALQADGRIVIGGQFTDVGNGSRNGIARLNADGSLDLTFDPGAGTGPGATDRGLNRVVYSTVMQPDGRVLVAGDFTNIVDTTRYYVARLESNGSLDGTFNPSILLAYGGLVAVKVQVDGKVVVGGDIARPIDGANPNDMARLLVDGSYDTNFSVGTGPVNSTGAPPLVRSIAIQPDGKLVIVGGFTGFNGVNRNFIARLLGDKGGTVEFDSANYYVEENGGNATIAVHRTGGTNGSVSVNYATSDGTATAGADYVAKADAVLFGPGETIKTFTIQILADSLVESNETVNITLANPIGGVILGNQKTATLTIMDNTNSVANHAPALAALSDQTVNEQTALTFTAIATDADGDSLTFSLESGAPAGAAITPVGLFTWTPSEDQGPGSYPITVRVTDNGSPPMSDSKSFTIVVNEVNSPPAIPFIGDKTAIPGTALTFTVSATDPDVPANSLTFTLDSGGPAGAAIDATSGVFTWTPPANQAPGTYPVTVRVTDNGVPSQNATRPFNIIVPARPLIQAVGASGGDVTITWSAAAGLNYRVQFKPNLGATTWTDLPGDVTAGGSTATKTDNTISGNERYYRIALLP